MGSVCCCFHVQDDIDNANNNNNNDVGFIPNLCNKIKEFAASIKNGRKESVNPSADQAAPASSTAPNEITPSGKRAQELVYLHDSNSIEHEDECPTCFEEYTPENPKTTMQCSHHYHLACIYEWMERSQYCPICRRVINFFPNSYNLYR
ncbi:unnamed protein product [Prunus armeniaca]|uniref:RING-type E3 ubiquitin transferase n=1 Tax=Prunus armeniaca TaxID=36596 RepID=A0A6J5TL96_PRUAR|nr:unnamed protein product [Prunus armeniaca]